MPAPTTFGVVAEQELFIVKEATPGTIPGTVGVPVPFTSFKPSDKPLWLEDESFQGNMGDIYGVYQGPLIASWDLGGHVFGDVLGHFLYNILGDYTVTGTTAAPSGTTNAALSVGATALPVASGGTSFTTGMYLWLEDAGSPAANEVVMVTATGSATSIPITATRFAHLTAMPFTNTAAPYTHVFALLNGTVGAANGPAQPPTHTLTHRNGLAANSANQYAYACVSELVFTGNSEKLLDYTAKGMCAARVTAGSAVGLANTSSVLAVPSWHTTTGLGGTVASNQVKDIAEHSITITRAVKAYNTEQGSQQPYIIARGKQGSTGKLVVSPAIDDTSLTDMLANTQPQLQFITSNGLSGANLVSLQVDVVLAAFKVADINDSSELFGYDVDFGCVHTSASGTGPVTTTGASGGKGAVKVTLVNAVPTY